MLRLIVMVCMSGLILFAASTATFADGLPPPNVVINPTSIPVTQQPLPEQAKSKDVGLAPPSPSIPAGLSQTSWFAHAVPTPPPALITQSRILFQVKAINCDPWEWCTATPQLHFIAKEYLKGFHVTQVILRIGGREKLYDGSDAVLTLPQTGMQGAWIDYWATSDHDKDQSQNFRLKYRYVQSAPDTGLFRFDLLGSDWADQAPSGSLTWGLFPPLDETLPLVLEQPLSVEYLHTTNRYFYLSGHLIQSGLVNISACPNGGLYANGSATPCGEKAGADKVLEWQNKYDEKIYTAALKYNIPARILKGILAQESQFWPISNDPYELGLGKFTENGAGMLLMWNIDYFLSTCIPVYGKTSCSSGYSSLNPTAQLMQRRSLMDKIGTRSEIDMLAGTLFASSAQINQMVINTSGKEPAVLTTYEDMWKIATGNYYAGSGCIGTALQRINDGALKLTWEQLVAQMDGSCKIATIYVERVFRASGYKTDDQFLQ